MPNYTTGRDRRPNEEVRKALLDQLRQGQTVKDALTIVGRSRSWYETQRREDKDFARTIDSIRELVNSPSMRDLQVPDFPEFCEKYLHRVLNPHQLNMFDVLEGREPRWQPPGVRYEPGSRGKHRVLVNVPPNHAKSQTITIEWVVWRLMKNPAESVLIISKTQKLAKAMLYAIKQRLTSPRYADLQLAFGPPEGFRAKAGIWSATQIYLDPDAREDGEKDATVEAVGLGGQIYGNRASIIIVDDAVLLTNASQWEDQMTWIRQDASTRLGPGGILAVIGTRVAVVDLYSELLNPDHYADKTVPWTVLKMPAVLEYHEDVDQWITLWPTSDEPFVEGDQPDENGRYTRWTGRRLAEIRNEVGLKRWAMVYQQQDVEDDATFDPIAVRSSVNGWRTAGVLEPGRRGHPDSTDGFYVICSMDPAIAGDCAAAAMAVDKQTNKRYLLDMRIITAPTPKQIRDQIVYMTETYRPSEWMIEENAFQGFLTQDEDLLQYMANKGIVMKAHRTGSQKLDPDFGVASMSGLFGTVEKDKAGNRRGQGDNLLELPSIQSFGVSMLVEQLVAWSPLVKTKNRKQDAVMALWFCELAARRVLSNSKRFGGHFAPNKNLSERDRARQMVINIDEYLEDRRRAAV